MAGKKRSRKLMRWQSKLGNLEEQLTKRWSLTLKRRLAIIISLSAPKRLAMKCDLNFFRDRTLRDRSCVALKRHGWQVPVDPHFCALLRDLILCGDNDDSREPHGAISD